MAQVQFSANLLTQQFPYNFYELANAVEINRGMEKSGRDVNQPYYADNVLPITDGFASIGFTEKVPANENLQNVRQSFVIYGPHGRLALFAADDSAAWVFDPRGSEWATIQLPTASFEELTFATIREETYIFLGTGIFRYNFETQVIEPVEVKGIQVSNMLGVSSAGGRLILWDDNRVYYSSPIDPLEFTPGLDTGAGSTGVEDLRGEIIACVTLGKDFIIYSKISAVSARATDNPTFPFRFKEVLGSSGVNFLRHVAYNSNVGSHIVWTNSGFQQVNVEEAVYVWPELSNGIIRGLQIRRNQLFGFPEIVQTESLELQISFVSNRFIAVSLQSLEEETYFDCFVLDTALERWGKLSIPHSGFIEYVLPEVFNIYTYGDLERDYYTYADLEGLNIAYRDIGTSNQARPTVEQGTNLGIILPNGSVQAISYIESGNFRGTSGEEFGALTPSLFLGRYKSNRENGVVTQWLKLRELFDAKLFWYGHTYDGSFARIEEIVHEDKFQAGHWFGRMSADSVSLELRGSFKLTDLNICYANAGMVNQLRPSLEVNLVQSSPAFPEPEFDYATSWIYSPYVQDEISIQIENFGTVNFDEVVKKSEQVDLSSIGIALSGKVSLRPLTVPVSLPAELSSISIELAGTVKMTSILVKESLFPETSSIGIDLSGTVKLRKVLIPFTAETGEAGIGINLGGKVVMEKV